MVSGPLPGGCAQMIVIGFDGYESCARATVVLAAINPASNSPAIRATLRLPGSAGRL